MAYGTQFGSHNEKRPANRSDVLVAVAIENAVRRECP
jgi:hypothetical protein